MYWNPKHFSIRAAYGLDYSSLQIMLSGDPPVVPTIATTGTQNSWNTSISGPGLSVWGLRVGVSSLSYMQTAQERIYGALTPITCNKIDLSRWRLPLEIVTRHNSLSTLFLTFSKGDTSSVPSPATLPAGWQPGTPFCAHRPSHKRETKFKPDPSPHTARCNNYIFSTEDAKQHV